MKKGYTLLLLSVIIALGTKAAGTFTSIATGNWNASATWSLTSGSDGDGIPDIDDDVTINAGHSITLIRTEFANNLLQNGTLVGGNWSLYIFKDFTNTGTVSGIQTLTLMKNSVYNSTSPITFTGALNCGYAGYTGNQTVQSGTINAANVVVQASFTVTNLATVNTGSSFKLNSPCEWINGLNSKLRIATKVSGSGVLTATATGNTVKYDTTSVNLTGIMSNTYYNLEFHSIGPVARTFTGNIVVLNDFLLTGGSNNINMGAYNLTIGGNWTNSTTTSTVSNQGTITFNGGGTQTISKTSSGNESFTNMVVGGTGTVLLAKAITVGQSLTVNSGTFDLSASNFSVNVLGNLVNNATINCRSGKFVFAGASAHTISGSTNTQFYDMQLNGSGGVTVNSAQSLSNELTVTNGNFNSNDNFTLLSDASKTARLAQVGATGSFSGNMTIQKFISARPGFLGPNNPIWHDMASPVQGTTIYDWDDEMYMSGFSNFDIPAGIKGVDGMAPSSQGGNFYSVQTYNEPTAAYAIVTSSTTVLTPGKGYDIFLSDNMSNWNAKTIDSRGVPNYGTKNIALSYSGSAGAYAGCNLVGNPFASPIDYSLVSKTNTDGHAYGYNDGVWTDYGTNAVITPHQGFWVYATSVGASLSIPESAKTAVFATSFHRSIPNYAIKLIYTGSDVEFYNTATVNFEKGATSKWDNELDAIYRSSPDAQASTVSFNTGEIKLLTNAINDSENNVTLPIDLFSPKPGLYYIQASVLNKGEYKYIWLENIRTGEKYDINKSIPINVDNSGDNSDYVLRLSKDSDDSQISQSVFESDLMIFNTESNLNLKSNITNHNLSQINIYDLSGRNVFTQKDIIVEQNSTYKFDISNLSSGVYIVNVTDTDGHVISKKIVK